MPGSWSLFGFALAYMALLFVVASLGDRRRISPGRRGLRGLIYVLSLGVYCTSWTFYGAVGNAAAGGWAYLPIYLGPALLMVLGFGVLQRIARESREQRITSVADYIAWRYGGSHAVAVLVTVSAVVGAVPYIALQLKGIVTSIEVLSPADGAGASGALPGGTAPWLAMALAGFAMAFGTRNLDASEHHRGLMWAIALESVVKLLAFVAVGLFVIFGLFDGPGALTARFHELPGAASLFDPWPLPDGFGIQLVLAMCAIVCLPRQFHVAVVESRGEGELRMARWLFPLYLLAFAAFVVPIAMAGLVTFQGTGVDPDTFVLALPRAAGEPALALLAFVGGFSAATGMVIISTVALAIMVSNDIVMPVLLRSGVTGPEGRDLSRTLLRVRRASILVVTLLALAYYRGLEAGMPLASIGLLAFAGAAQFAPAILLGLYWRGASKAGAVMGLAAGGMSWFVLLLLPSVPAFGGEAPLDFNEGALVCLALNVLATVLGSLMLPDQSGRDRDPSHRGSLPTLGELADVVGRFLGPRSTREALCTHLGTPQLESRALVSPATLQFAERLLAGSIGSASARSVLLTSLQQGDSDSEAVRELVDRTSRAVQFSRELLEATLDNLSQGVSVVDEDLRLVGWNRRYLELMAYPEGTVYLGQPVEELIRLNARRGLLADGDSEAGIQRRLDRLRGTEAYRFERAWPDGKVIELRGNPMPGGGYVTTFTDITRYKTIERDLQEVNETLESRVAQRTRDLSSAIGEVDAARELAEEANRSKTRFLAAASHDLLQPMNAARLFISVLRQQPGLDEEQQRLVTRADRSLTAAEELLSALLDISKLDSGMYEPELRVLSVAELFEQLRRRFKALAANQGLVLRVRSTDHLIVSDRNLLYRVLQNLLSNAIRYTERGGVLLACRRRGKTLELGVWDTGVGIDEAGQARIFEEFQRLAYAEGLEEKGLGLGLAISERIARVLGQPLEVRSRPGRGSRFSIRVPLADGDSRPSEAQAAMPGPERVSLHGARVLCVDNEPEILDGMATLLRRWGCDVAVAGDADEALRQAGAAPPELLLLDYHLGGGEHGLELARRLLHGRDPAPPVVVITADRSAEVEAAVTGAGHALLRKPLRPAALRALLSNLLRAARSRA